MNAPRHSEAAFETVVEHHLLHHGFVGVSPDGFDRQRAIFPAGVLDFIKDTQPKEWTRLEALHGPKTGEQILTDLCKWMDVNGSLATLRHGFKCYGRTLHVAYFKAAHELNPELERLYVFVRHLMTKLPHRASGAAYQFDDEVKLEYYRIQKISEGSISLRDGSAEPLYGPTAVGSGANHEENVRLSQLIDVVNDRFGTEFNQADQLFFDQIVEAALSDDGLRTAASVNSAEKFQLLFRNVLEQLFTDRMDQNEDIFVRFMNDQAFQKVVTAWMGDEAYKRLRDRKSDGL